MVKLLERKDYDGKLSTYPKPNTRKDLIMERLVEVLHYKHGVRRSKEQLRKRWSDLKLREQKQLHKIHRIIRKGM